MTTKVDSIEIEIVAIAIGGLVTLVFTPQTLGLWEMMVGLILLALLLRRWGLRRHRRWLGVAYSGTFALAFLATTGVGFEWTLRFIDLPVEGFMLAGKFVAPWRDVIFFLGWVFVASLTRFVPQIGDSCDGQ